MFVDEKSAGEKQPVQVGTLKLSEAMRIGSKIRPQGFSFNDPKGSCAIMAAMEAATGHRDFFDKDCPHPKLVWPELGNGDSGTLMSQIWDKNDSERLTREQIADWLESQGY